jgi:hypothetical protein
MAEKKWLPLKRPLKVNLENLPEGTTLRVISAADNIYVIEHLLSDDECQRIIEDAEPHLTPSLSYDADLKPVRSETRTSYGALMNREKYMDIISRMTNLLEGYSSNDLDGDPTVIRYFPFIICSILLNISI